MALDLEVAFGLQVADHRLDGGSMSQLALDHSETPPFWPER
jgi:hypothetical protein